MNNEIGRKITSLTLMTIMLAGGMVIAAPSMMPVAHAANANLFVSAENSQFDNYMSGPQVIEVVVIDSDINDTDELKGEPDVTVNGKILRMVQAIDGNWYGYFADRVMAQIADSTAALETDAANRSQGLDFGTFCSAGTAIDAVGVDLGDTNGVAIPGDGGIDGQADGEALTDAAATCAALGTPFINNVVREAKDPNGNVTPLGQIDLDSVDVWPFIQLYTLNPTGNVVVQYNKGGGVQTTTLTFDTVDQFAGSALDGTSYPAGTEVHATITDLWLNIDPTDEDSWTFGSVGTISTNYQVFDENGGTDGDLPANTDGDLTSRLADLMCEDNCILEFNPDVQGKGVIGTLQDNDDSAIMTAGDPDDPLTWSTAGGNLAGNVPITITEQGPNSGVFGTYDESDKSVLIITGDAARGTSASIEYNETAVTILVGFILASIDIIPIDDEWSSGEEIIIELFDGDANKNSRADEDLDLNNPDVDLIPSLRTGSPATLSGLTAASVGGDDFVAPNGKTLDDDDNDAVQGFSDRALLVSSSVTNTLVSGDTFDLTFGTMDDFFNAAPINDDEFSGFALFNYDIRSLTDNVSGIGSFDIDIAGIEIASGITDRQGLVLIENDDIDALKVLPKGDDLIVSFTLNDDGGPPIGDLDPATTLPVVVDVFGFGFVNDGLESDERIANQIIRLELEETGDNTSIFEGSLEYTMINQLNILDSNTYENLSTIADDPTFIVIEDLTDEDSPRVNYLDLGADGVSTQVSDQEEAPSHSGIVSFDLDTYKTADTVVITLQDLDLNVDSDLIDIYTTISDSSINALNDVVGDDANNFVFSDDDNLGRVLDVTFDDELWTASNEEACTNSLLADGIDTGLAATGFTLIETDRDSGEFVGDFQIPARWCAEGDNSPTSATGLDIEVNYVDFRDASGEIIEVGDSAGVRANTGSISLDRTVYPVPFGVPDNFGDLDGDTSPENRSIFAIHATGINDDLTEDGTFLPDGDLTVHLRVNDPDFDVSASGEDKIAQNQSGKTIGPVELSIIRGSETVILGYAGGPSIVDGTINVGSELIGDGMVSDGEITIDSSTIGFPSDNDGDSGAFVDGAIEIMQGSNTVDATFTDNALNGLDSGSEINTLLDGAGDLSLFTDGLITIEHLGTGDIVAAIFTDSGAAGLGSGSEISQIATVGAGSVLICQTGMSTNDCARGLFVNDGTEEIDESELEIQSSVDIAGTLPVVLTLDDDSAAFGTTGTTGTGTATTLATVNWIDLNDDTNIDDGELTIINNGAGFTDGEIIDIVDPNGDPGDVVAPFLGDDRASIATVLFDDTLDTLETSELFIENPPSGNGFLNGPVTITPNPPISGVEAEGEFIDTPAITQFGPIDEIAPDAGIFELDVTIQYTDGPSDDKCPTTVDFDASEDGIQGELTRFNTAAPSGENYCILQGDILQVEYTDPTDASGDENSVTDSATFDLRNGVLQSDKSVYIIGSDMILTLIEPDLDLDNDQAETWDLDLIEWDSDAATITMGDADDSAASFDPEPLNFRETGDSTGIFQIVIEIPEELENDTLERGEEIILEYTDWGPSGSDFVGDEDEDVNVTIFTSNFGATVELDQKVYTWTDKVYMTIVAPDHNFDGDLIDEIGNSDDDPIKISTRGFDIDNYKLVETGTDTGIFTGEIILTGFEHDADGKDGNDTNPRTEGSGPTDGFLQTDDDDGLTVSFEFSEDETIVGSSLIRWNIGEVQWLEASYPASGTGVVRVIDPDMNLDPEAVDNFDVDVWSDSDAGGIDLTVTETNEATGIFEGTVFFTVADESSGHRLRVAEGDTVTAEYEDNTLPDPYTTADELDITATSLIGTIVPPLERAPAASLRVVDAFGNSLDTVSVNQQVQISADLANGQDREQAFAYLVQIQDGNGVTVALAWITGSLAPGQSFSPALSWIPTQAGTYTATAFVWESVDNPTALSPPVSTTITVV